MAATDISPGHAGPNARDARATRDWRSGERVFVHLWDWPLRLTHWVSAAVIVVLVVTGFYIGKPYFFVRDVEPRLVTSWMRLLHFGAAGFLVAAGIMRLYLFVFGNRFERFPALVPHRVRDLRNLGRQIVYYGSFGVRGAPSYLGHNPLQQLAYLGFYVVIFAMIATGFALYGFNQPGSFFDDLFGWVNGLLGGVTITRFVHHVLTWVFLVFVPLHVYLSLRADLVEEPGMVSSMISGGRWVENRDFEDLSREDLKRYVQRPSALRVHGVAAVTAGLVGAVLFAVVQAVVTLVQGGSLWPPQAAIGSILLGRDFITTMELVPTWVLAFVGLFTHAVLSILFGFVIALLVHRLGMIAALVTGLLVGLVLFLFNVAALAGSVTGVPIRWGVLPAHLAYGLVAAWAYKALKERRS